ncbi:MAG: tetraacyldisaccharide 4'-kinase, partial [Parvularculaceae bacterium]
MKEPWFWRDRSVSAQMARALLAPVSGLYDAGGRLRSALTKPHAAGVPVICIGAASIGGAGKTPFALMFAEKLRLRGKIAHFATRGYGGALTGPVRVNDNHCAEDVGDEALLLAAAAATFVAKDRLAGARA